MRAYDLLLKGGHLIDPAGKIDAPMDIAFKDGKTARLEPDIDASAANETRNIAGCIVTPGLIDMHTHVYWGGTSLGIDAETFCRMSAVTTAIDTGSAGPGNFAGFRRHVIEPAKTRILAYLHISHAGIFGFSNRIMVGESENLALMDPVTACEVADANRDVIIGIKVRLGRHASGIHGMAPFDLALQAAEETGLALMVHIDEPPPSYAEVVERLRCGDILTHCFRPFPNSPLTSNGRPRPEVLAARQRGVKFDIGHGMGSFSFDVAQTMLDEGFAPDTISSDVHALCINGPAFDLVTTLSKFLHLGMPLKEVIRCATQNAASALGRPQLGRLEAGGIGDASVLRLNDGEFDLTDTTGKTLTADKRLSAAGAVVNGTWWDPV